MRSLPCCLSLTMSSYLFSVCTVNFSSSTNLNNITPPVSRDNVTVESAQANQAPKHLPKAFRRNCAILGIWRMCHVFPIKSTINIDMSLYCMYIHHYTQPSCLHTYIVFLTDWKGQRKFSIYFFWNLYQRLKTLIASDNETRAYKLFSIIDYIMVPYTKLMSSVHTDITTID